MSGARLFSVLKGHLFVNMFSKIQLSLCRGKHKLTRKYGRVFNNAAQGLFVHQLPAFFRHLLVICPSSYHLTPAARGRAREDANQFLLGLQRFPPAQAVDPTSPHYAHCAGMRRDRSETGPATATASTTVGMRSADRCRARHPRQTPRQDGINPRGRGSARLGSARLGSATGGGRADQARCRSGDGWPHHRRLTPCAMSSQTGSRGGRGSEFRSDRQETRPDGNALTGRRYGVVTPQERGSTVRIKVANSRGR